MLTVEVLGPVAVSVDGQPVVLTSPKLRVLLAALAMKAGSAVSVDRLAVALWGDHRPDHVRRSVQTLLTRLRGALGSDLIATEPAGYRLCVEPELVDALRFERLLDAAAQAPDAAAEGDLLATALALWRGNPFENVPSESLADAGARLVERYLVAVERKTDLDLADGRHRELVGRLHELTASYPFRESLWVRLLTALDRCGRQAEALTWYESIRRRLAEDIGVNPGPELRQIHADLLADRPVERQRTPALQPKDAIVPRQLPADIVGFTGRATAVKALDELVDDPDRLVTNAVVISAIAGMAGIGKTSLAVHWAHHIAARFPDGQLYVNLRGFHPSGQAMASAEAVRQFLDALGVPPPRIPADPDARAGLYRSMLDGRRMLVLLDNARDADQVRPLLPGSPTCLVVVTSRSRLTGLVAAGAARPLTLNLLPADEARDLLAHRLGSARMAADPDAADAIIARCAGLPLALAIIAALAATSSLPLATIAAELDDECSTLDTLDAGDPLSDARAVFSWSYRTLSPDGAQLFRLLGLHPGPDISTAAGASLVGRPLRETRRLFVELCTASLLTEHVPGRYVLHDLLRAYAIELAHTHDDHATRQHSIHRLLDHYLHTAHGAALLVTPHRTMAVEPAQPGVAPESLADHEHALAWFTAEHRVLLTAIGHAAAHGFDRHVWQLAWILWDVLSQRGYWHEWYETQHAGLAATQRLADSDAEALAHRGVAQACAHLGRYAEAGPHLRQALALYRQMGDRHGLADAELSLCALLSRQNRHTEALHHCEQARDMFAAVGDQRGEALALSTIGFLHSELSHGAEAIEYGQRAVTLIRQLHDHSSEASVLTNLGYAHHRIGQHRQAVRYYERAARMFEALGSHFLRAEALLDLGDTHLAAGEPDAARTAWRKALELFDASGNPQADKARTRLATIAPV